MKFTHYFHAMRLRPDRAFIRDEWIQRVIESTVSGFIQHDGRIRGFGGNSVASISAPS